MSGAFQDWIVIVVFFATFLLVTAGEVYWLANRFTVPIRKALTTVFVANFLTITLGFLVSFIIFAVLLGAADGNTEMPGGEAGTWAAFITALGFPLLLMAGTKRLLIAGMRIGEIARPLPYSIVSTLIFFAAVFGLPAIFLTFR